MKHISGSVKESGLKCLLKMVWLGIQTIESNHVKHYNVSKAPFAH